MNIGTPTFSSFLHGIIALVLSGLVWAGAEYVHPTIAFVLAGPIFFYGREMTSYQFKREARGVGKANKLILRDLSPVSWARGGQSDGFWDFVIPLAMCAVGGGTILLLHLLGIL